jgi:hypothetical protein
VSAKRRQRVTRAGVSTGRGKVEVREVNVSRPRGEVVRRVDVQKAYEQKSDRCKSISEQGRQVLLSAGRQEQVYVPLHAKCRLGWEAVGRRQGPGLPLASLGLALSARLTSERHFRSPALSLLLTHSCHSSFPSSLPHRLSMFAQSELCLSSMAIALMQTSNSRAAPSRL